jgi:hypothetical protein
VDALGAVDADAFPLELPPGAYEPGSL